MKGWSRALLLQSVVLNSAVNILVPALIAFWIDIRLVAVWLSLRAGVNLAVAAIPSPAHSLLAAHLRGDHFEPDDIRLAETRNFIVLCAVIIAIAVGILFSNMELTRSFALQAAIFSGLFFGVTGLSVAFRIARDARGMRRMAIVEVVLSALTLPLILLGFGPFLMGMVAKEIARLGLFATHFTNRSFSLPAIARFEQMGSQYLRGLSQVATQYAERLLFPVIFGTFLAGSLGLGSTLGVALTILSSNMLIWAFREIGVGNESATRALHIEWSTLLLAASGMPWGVYAVANAVGLATYADPIVALGAGFTATLGVNFLATSRNAAALHGSRALLLHMGCLALSYAALVQIWWESGSVAYALSSAVMIQLVYALLLGPKKPAFMIAIMFAAAAFGVYVLSMERAVVIFWPLALAVGLLLGAPYAVAKVMRQRAA